MKTIKLNSGKSTKKTTNGNRYYNGSGSGSGRTVIGTPKCREQLCCKLKKKLIK